MKRAISIILALLILTITVNVDFSALAISKETSIDTIVDELQHLYEEQEQIGNNFETSINNRIILKSKRCPAEYKGGNILALNNNMYVVQYDNESCCNNALEYYNNQSYIQWAEKDGILETMSWSFGTDMLGTDEAKKYCETNNIEFDNEVKVAVVDAGIRFGMNPFYKSGRVIDSGFNSSGEGDETTAKWVGGTHHGSNVASIILDNTTDNVKIYGYKAFNTQGGSSNLSLKLAVDKAVEDEMQIINISAGGTNESKALEESIINATEKGIIVVVSAGNSNDLVDDTYYPATIDEAITVSAIDYRGNKAFFSNYGTAVDFTALGYDVDVYGQHSASTNTVSGTSFSAPYIAACCAEVLSVHPFLTPSEVEDKLKQVSLQPEQINYSSKYLSDIDIRLNELKLAALNSDAEDDSLYFGNGFPQMQLILGESISCNVPKFSVESGTYNDTFNLSITADNGDIIYYTLDGKYPTAKEGILYTAPITISKTTSIRAISYSDNKTKSIPVSAEYRIAHYADESDFSVDNRGYITSYTGLASEIIVPDTINGKLVRGIATKGLYDDFDEEYYIENEEEYSLDGHLTSVVLPDTVVEIEKQGLNNSVLKYLTAKGLKTIGESGLEAPLIYLDAPNIEQIGDKGLAFACLSEIDFSNLTSAGWGAFTTNNYLVSVNLPKLKTATDSIFYDCERLTKVNLESAETLETDAFRDCYFLRNINVENVKELKGERVFNYCKNLRTLYLPELVTSNSKHCFEDCYYLSTISIPKLKSIDDYYFVDCQRLRRLYLESVETIGKGVFGGSEQQDYCAAAYLYAPKLIKAESLPAMKTSKIVLSSAFTECSEETKGRNYSVAGITGSYAQTWAENNEHNFYGIPFIDIDISEEYNGDIPLSIKGVGIDVKYEWYGCDDENKTNSVLITTEKEGQFNPKEHKYYQYYFCKCVMYDNGNPFEANSVMCKNTDYREADYSEYYAAVDRANAINRNNYIDCSELDNLLEIDVSNLSNNEQVQIDELTQKINEAIDNLHYKAADYSEYNAAVEKANELDRDDYMDFSAVDEALSKDIGGKNITEQNEVDKQTETILKAIETLKKKDIVYEIVQGANSTFDISKDTELVIASNATFEKFIAVLVDDVELDKNAYSAKSGSTVITITADYLKTLALKEHRIIISSTDGYASTVFTVIKSDAEESTTKPDGTTSPSTTKLTETTTESTTNKEKENTTVKRDNSLFSPKTGNNFSDTLVYVVALSYVIVGLLFVKKRQQKIN